MYHKYKGKEVGLLPLEKSKQLLFSEPVYNGQTIVKRGY